MVGIVSTPFRGHYRTYGRVLMVDIVFTHFPGEYRSYGIVLTVDIVSTHFPGEYWTYDVVSYCWYSLHALSWTVSNVRYSSYGWYSLHALSWRISILRYSSYGWYSLHALSWTDDTWRHSTNEEVQPLLFELASSSPSPRFPVSRVLFLTSACSFGSPHTIVPCGYLTLEIDRLHRI
jgi:hypothetical protein